MPSSDQNPHWISAEVWPTRPGHHSPVPLIRRQENQTSKLFLHNDSGTSSASRPLSAEAGIVRPSLFARLAELWRSRWVVPRPFHQSPHEMRHCQVTTKIPPLPHWHIPRWELETHFLRSFEIYEDAMLQALSTLIGPVAERLDLHGRIRFLEDLGLLSEAAKTSWSNCLGVRRRVLLEDRDYPRQDEVTEAWQAMNALATELVSVVLTMKVNSHGSETC